MSQGLLLLLRLPGRFRLLCLLCSSRRSPLCILASPPLGNCHPLAHQEVIILRMPPAPTRAYIISLVLKISLTQQVMLRIAWQIYLVMHQAN